MYGKELLVAMWICCHVPGGTTIPFEGLTFRDAKVRISNE